jgi:polyribonucleotide 5'-hydroxyl-kinase
MTSSALIPIAYWFGHREPRRNVKLMDHLTECLGTAIEARMQEDDLCMEFVGNVSGPS